MVGGFAAVAHGVTLLTQDIDVCCRFTPDNLMRLPDALSDLHPVHRMPPERPPLRLTPEVAAGFRNLYLETDWGQLDCLGEILGVGGYDEVLAQSVEIELPGGPCRILAIDALVRAKQVMGRDKDRETIVQLRAIQERTRGH